MVRSCTQVARGKRADAVIVALPATIVIDVTIIFHSVLIDIYMCPLHFCITIFLELYSMSLNFRARGLKRLNETQFCAMFVMQRS